MKKELTIGAHMSIAGGYSQALHAAESIGATTMQIFTANQRQWHTRPIHTEELDAYFDALKSSSVHDIMSHDSYLINLGSPKEDVLEKSRKAFCSEIERCAALGISRLNFHPGAALDDSREKCLDRIVESLLLVEPLFEKCEKKLTLLIECMAGQGSVVGSSFEELQYILERTKHVLPMGVCVDTCHAFAAGYDLRTEEALDSTLKEFDRIIGLRYLKALHLNDSEKVLGSRVDRHAPIGEGEIGINGFRAIVRHPVLSEIPMYLETPGGLELWQREIALLRSFAKL